nr:hypothetical protein 49p1_00138 [Yersinia frederiksenii]
MAKFSIPLQFQQIEATGRLCFESVVTLNFRPAY